MQNLIFYLKDILPILVFGVTMSFVAIYFYFALAKKFDIYAQINNRSLHVKKTITSTGIIMPIILFFHLFLEYIFTKNDVWNFSNYLILLCSVYSFIGLIDDKVNVSARKKFVFQTILSIIILILLNKYIENVNYFYLNFLLLLFSTFLILFFINTFNFLDGIDGMALSISFFTIITYKFFFENVNTNSIIILLCIITSLFLFNIKKKCFIGDSGSLFLGSIIGFITITGIYYYNWDLILVLIILSYWVSDVSTTFFLRFFFVKKWYGTHTMHPYQNFAKKVGSHLKVIIILNLFNFIYILPICFIYISNPDLEYIEYTMLFLAYLPSIFFSIKFGPLQNIKHKNIKLFKN